MTQLSDAGWGVFSKRKCNPLTFFNAFYLARRQNGCTFALSKRNNNTKKTTTFVQNTILRHNNLRVRKELVNLGYKTVHPTTTTAASSPATTRRRPFPETAIEAVGGHSEIMFLALCALRNDNNQRRQWFVNKDGNRWYQNGVDRMSGNLTDYRKATAEEIS